jgi:UDP-N-acetylglucosamine--N-acetylmuramyl-(pentapeptide) pyrophosphoryl-undecaprenol N-acetylglucosamine transferase
MARTKLKRAPAPLRVLITGGGTGGHLFPGVAIAREFQRRDPAAAILFVGTGRPLEAKVLPAAGIRQAVVTVRGLKGMGLWHKLRTLLRLPLSVVQAAGIVWRFAPRAVIGVGGYAAGPVCLAAYLLGKPVFLQEQNLLPGITNRLLARCARRIYLTFADSEEHFPPHKTRLTGNPVREAILQIALGVEAPRHPQAPFTVLIMGGSQGAHGINAAVMEMLAAEGAWREFSFMHQTGADDREAVRRAYAAAGVAAEVEAFFDDMARRYNAADLVICRAGATTVAELTCVGRAAIFVPFPHAADNHQERNAETLVAAGAAEMIREAELNGARLGERLTFYRDHPVQLAHMASSSRRQGRPRAAAAIVEDILSMVAAG